MYLTQPGGHRDLGHGCHAWLQGGGWGYSNAGLVVGRGRSLLVDTLFDVRTTATMLAGLAPATAVAPIGTVVNTHGNGDHWFGNQLLAGAEIIASAPTLREMHEVGPDQIRELLALPDRTGDYARSIFGGFHFAEVVPTYPTRTFTDWLHLTVGGVGVELITVGPAHTEGDTIVFVPAARTVFTGDIVFAGGTPVVWAGPIANWTRACRLLLDLDVDTVVPGHGPVCGKQAVRDLADYLDFVHQQASARFAAGMPAADAAADIPLGRFAGLPESERLAVNVHAVYRKLDPGLPTPTGPHLFGCMARFLKD